MKYHGEASKDTGRLSGTYGENDGRIEKIFRIPGKTGNDPKKSRKECEKVSKSIKNAEKLLNCGKLMLDEREEKRYPVRGLNRKRLSNKKGALR